MAEFETVDPETATQGVFSYHSGAVRLTSLNSVVEQLWIEIAKTLGFKRYVSGQPYLSEKLFTCEGLDGEMMTPSSKGWIRGRIRLRVHLEFCPKEEPLKADSSTSLDSVLDEIRSGGML